MTKRSILAGLAGLALALGVPAAAQASPARVIFGPCTAVEDGQVMVIGPFLYECVNTGFGWFWVRWESDPYTWRQGSVLRDPPRAHHAASPAWQPRAGLRGGLITGYAGP